MKPAGFVPEQVTKLPGRISAAATVRGGRGARLPARAPISVAPETERPFLSRRGGESFAKATVGNAFGYDGGCARAIRRTGRRLDKQPRRRDNQGKDSCVAQRFSPAATASTDRRSSSKCARESY